MLQYPPGTAARALDAVAADIEDRTNGGTWTGPHNTSGTYDRYRLRRGHVPVLFLRCNGHDVAVQLVGPRGGGPFEPLFTLAADHDYTLTQ